MWASIVRRLPCFNLFTFRKLFSGFVGPGLITKMFFNTEAAYSVLGDVPATDTVSWTMLVSITAAGFMSAFSCLSAALRYSSCGSETCSGDVVVLVLGRGVLSLAPDVVSFWIIAGWEA